MVQPLRMTPEIEAMALRPDLTYREIADKTGLAVSTISHHMINLGIRRSRGRRPGISGRKQTQPKGKAAEIMKMHLAGFKAESIAQALKVSRQAVDQTVRRWQDRL